MFRSKLPIVLLLAVAGCHIPHVPRSLQFTTVPHAPPLPHVHPVRPGSPPPPPPFPPPYPQPTIVHPTFSVVSAGPPYPLSWLCPDDVTFGEYPPKFCSVFVSFDLKYWTLAATLECPPNRQHVYGLDYRAPYAFYIVSRTTNSVPNPPFPIKPPVYISPYVK